MKKELLLSICLLLALGTLSAFNLNMMMVSAATSPYIVVVPESTVTTDLTVGMLYTISVYTDYTGDDVWGYEFMLTYNPSVLEGYEVVNGDLITEEEFPGRVMFLSAGFDNTAGKLGLTGAGVFFLPPFLPPGLTSGPETLAYVTFRVVGTGTSDITLETNGPERTKLIGYREVGGEWEQFHIIDSETDPDHIGHGSFDNSGAPAYPPYPPVAVIVGDADVYINEPVEFDGSSSYDPDGTAIIDYNWDFGDETIGTLPMEIHTYTTVGIYEVTLVVTDNQSQIGDPVYFTVEVGERATWAADLSQKKAWPERRHFDQSNHGQNNTLYAKVENIGLETVDVKVKFNVYSARGGEHLGTIETGEASLESLQTTVLTAEFDTTDPKWGTPTYKVYLDTRCFYFDGAMWHIGETSKAFSITVVP